MTVEQQVARHYGHRDLEANILAALKQAGKDVAHLTIDDLAGLDEFHLGWREQTARLARDGQLSAGQHVLDIGSGIGGPARYFAERHQCRATGLDLTPEFVAAAEMLTQRCGLAGKASFKVGSALAMPFAAESFDAACLIHVGMNIADKPALFAETRRVLQPGGRFAVYDVMATGDAPLTYPMPWSETPEMSFVASPARYREWLKAADFILEAEHDRRDSVLEQVKAMRARAAAEGPPMLGLHVIMGPQAKIRLQNVMAALEQGHIAPIEMILRAA